MKRTFMAIGLALTIGMSSPMIAQAKTPPDVTAAYESYKAAIKAGQRQEAAQFAYDAWQSAEKQLGDTKATGDLAAIFAGLKPKFLNREPAWKKVIQAHKRAIDLAEFDRENPERTELKRRVDYLSWLVPLVPSKTYSEKNTAYGVEHLKARVLALGYEGSMFDAEGTALIAQTAILEKNWMKAQNASVAAITLFGLQPNGAHSKYEDLVHFYLGRAFTAQGQHIEAALTYQALIETLQGVYERPNKTLRNAYGKWLQARDAVEAMKSDDPRAQDILRFTILNDEQNGLVPLIRVSPKIPRQFFKSRNSGWVSVVFSIDENGKVLSPSAKGFSNKILRKPALESVMQWRYSPSLGSPRLENIEVLVRFDMADGKGGILPFPEKHPLPR